MRTLHTSLAALVALTLALVLPAAGHAAEEGQTVYTRYNIHAQVKKTDDGFQVGNASYANYTRPGAGHVILPAGSKVILEDVGSRRIVFKAPDAKMIVHFEYHKARMGMSAEEYLDKITSPKPVNLNKLSKVDQEGIKKGVAMKGMSKQGVLAALGYPAAHRTPSLDNASWTYWTNRFGTVVVNFNGKGVVESTRD